MKSLSKKSLVKKSTLKKLPVDVSNFALMIKKNYLYIDKTEIIHSLIDKRRLYFLSRPRRFGKSLLISTLKEIFSGNKKLFKDLWIGKHSGYAWPKHPVLHFDFSNLSLGTAHEFKESLFETLDRMGKDNNIDVNNVTQLGSKLNNLIQDLSKKKSVAVLIDEYDAPLLANLGDLEKAKAIQEVMKNFFSVLKSMDALGHIHAIFITGVTRFSKTSLFSGFNNLNDMTLEPEAATLLGYTKEELEHYFKDYIEQFAKEKNCTPQQMTDTITQWYNGYRFSRDEHKVFNPFSVLHCFDKQNLANYWLSTGTPGFLIELLKSHYGATEDIQGHTVSDQFLGSFELGTLPLVPILYQAGYLTLDTYNSQTQEYTLKYPNEEVSLSFKKYIVASLIQRDSRDVETALSQIKNALEENDLERFCTILKSLIAGIPYQLHGKSEGYYHSLLHLIADMIGIDGRSEITTSEGRIDFAVQTKSRIFVFELKYNSTPQKALDQIIQKNYALKYERFKKPTTLVGIAFNAKRKEFSLDWRSLTKPEAKTGTSKGA